MEKTDDAVVVPMDAGWSDIGSWSAIWDVSKKDLNQNVLEGDILAHNSKRSLIKSEDKLICVVDINDLIVISTKDAVLVANKNSDQNVKKITEKQKNESRSEWEYHREIYRPWGKFDVIDEGSGYKVKRITVKPGAKLSVQKHDHRAEHWVVVSGRAKVTKGEESFFLEENQSTFIPIGEIHALENCDAIELELIEVQSGSYLGEDDITRFDDLYGRTT